MSSRTADVAVIGGGIIGVSCAYQLVKDGAGRVVLFDKSVLGSGTTSGSGGVIALHDMGALYAQMSLVGYKRIRALQAEYGLGFNQWGRLVLRRGAEQAPVEPTPYEVRFGGGADNIYMHDELSAAEVRARFPWITMPELEGASFYPNQGFIDTYELVDLYRCLAVATGLVEVLPNTPVLQIRASAGRVSSVITRRGQWTVGSVVNAGGPWGAKVAQLAGSSVDLVPQRIQVCMATSFEAGVDDAPFVSGAGMELDGERIWLRGEIGGMMLFAEHHDTTRLISPTDPDFVNRAVDKSFTAAVSAQVKGVLDFSGAAFLDGWCCVYGTTCDGHPIIGEDSTCAGLYHAIGLNGHGMTCHAAVALAISALVRGFSEPLDLESVTGKSEHLDFSALSPNRFESGRLLDFNLYPQA